MPSVPAVGPHLLALLLISPLALEGLQETPLWNLCTANICGGEVVFRTFLSKAAVLCYPDNTWIWRKKPKEGRKGSKQQFCAGLTRFQKAKFYFFFREGVVVSLQ